MSRSACVYCDEVKVEGQHFTCLYTNLGKPKVFFLLCKEEDRDVGPVLGCLSYEQQIRTREGSWSFSREYLYW